MALTDAERKLLEELEKTLTEQDPKLASKLAQPAPTQHPARVVSGVIGFIVGLIALVVGMSSYWWVSVIGFVVMLVSAVIAASGWARPASGTEPTTTSASTPSGEDSFLARLEQRWRDRMEQ